MFESHGSGIATVTEINLEQLAASRRLPPHFILQIAASLRLLHQIEVSHTARRKRDLGMSFVKWRQGHFASPGRSPCLRMGFPCKRSATGWVTARPPPSLRCFKRRSARRRTPSEGGCGRKRTASGKPRPSADRRAGAEAPAHAWRAKVCSGFTTTTCVDLKRVTGALAVRTCRSGSSSRPWPGWLRSCPNARRSCRSRPGTGRKTRSACRRMRLR